MDPEAIHELGPRGAGDENRTRTISLRMSGAGRPDLSIRSQQAPWVAVSYRESPVSDRPIGHAMGAVTCSYEIILCIALPCCGQVGAAFRHAVGDR